MHPTTTRTTHQSLPLKAVNLSNVPIGTNAINSQNQNNGNGQVTIQKIPGLSVFLTKTYNIFSIKEYSEKDWCCWGANGDTIVFKSIEQFSKNVLPKYFKHSNFQSFVRQLNMYDFRKTAQNPNHVEFQHPFFRRNQPELLINIKRKPSRHKVAQSKTTLGGPTSSAAHGSTAGESHLTGRKDGRKSIGSMGGHGADSDNYYENEGDDDEGEDYSENDHDAQEYYDHSAQADGHQKTRAPGMGVAAGGAGVAQIEARVSRLETENNHLRQQVDSLQLKSIVLQSILDELFNLLGTKPSLAEGIRTIAKSNDLSADAPEDAVTPAALPSPKESAPPSVFTNEFIEEAKWRIYQAAIEKSQTLPSSPLFAIQLQGMLFPYTNNNLATSTVNTATNNMGFPSSSYGTDLSNLNLDGHSALTSSLHALDGVELSRLRGGPASELLIQPSSFDLAASSVHPSSMQFGRLNSFYGGDGPAVTYTGSSLELLSSSADILTERDHMSSYDYSKFASVIDKANESGTPDDRPPLLKKQRNSEVSMEEEPITVQPPFQRCDQVDDHSGDVKGSNHPETSSVSEPIENSNMTVEPMETNSEQVEPANILLTRLDSTITNLSRLDSLDSALSAIFKNIEGN